MKKFVVLAVVSLACSMSMAAGDKPKTAQQQLMGTCNTEATGKKGDERSPWFCFRNQATALKTFKIPKKPAKGYCEYRGKATVTVNQYSVYREESEGSDMAQLLGTQNIKPLSPKKCYVGY